MNTTIDDAEFRRGLDLIAQGLAILQNNAGGRNPDWFRSNMKDLSDEGIAEMGRRFANGDTTYSVAKEMRVHYTTAAYYRRKWADPNWQKPGRPDDRKLY